MFANLSSISELSVASLSENQHSPTVMLNLLGEHIPAIQAWHAGLPAEAHLHWYGKAEVQPRRKMAHLNLCAASLDEALEELEKWNLRSPPKRITPDKDLDLPCKLQRNG